MWGFEATVNYPETKADTPNFTAKSELELVQLFIKLIREEKDATSFVITIVKLK